MLRKKLLADETREDATHRLTSGPALRPESLAVFPTAQRRPPHDSALAEKVRAAAPNPATWGLNVVVL